MKEQKGRKNYGMYEMDLTVYEADKMRAIKEILHKGKDAQVKLGKNGEIKVYATSLDRYS